MNKFYKAHKDADLTKACVLLSKLAIKKSKLKRTVGGGENGD